MIAAPGACLTALTRACCAGVRAGSFFLPTETAVRAFSNSRAAAVSSASPNLPAAAFRNFRRQAARAGLASLLLSRYDVFLLDEPTNDLDLDGLARLERYQFPFELNEVTREYFARESAIVGGPIGADMKAILSTPPEAAAWARLSAIPYYNARIRTTCVATRLEVGHANNALPGMARANVNCRILPGHSPDEIQGTIVKVLDDPKIVVSRAAGLAGSGLPSERTKSPAMWPLGLSPPPEMVLSWM